MADKEATVYVVDVGKSMNEKRHGRGETDLHWGMRYVWDKLATTVCHLTGVVIDTDKRRLAPGGKH